MTFDPDPHTAPEFEHAALLTIDVQNDTITTPGPLEIPGTAQAVPAMARLAGAFREAGRPIVHVVRRAAEERSRADGQPWSPELLAPKSQDP